MNINQGFERILHKKYAGIILIVLFCFKGHLASQTSFDKKKITLWSINTAHTGINSIHLANLRMNRYRTFKIGFLDNHVPLSLNKGVSSISDLSFAGTALATGLFLLKQTPKEDRLNHSLRVFENAWITYNLTETFKNTTKRVRPYAYQGIVKKDDIRSFISGHSSLTASMASSLWLSKPKNKTLPVVATGLALGTAALRVQAGKHFVSDVLSGMVVGFGVALIREKIKPINRQ